MFWLGQSRLLPLFTVESPRRIEEQNGFGVIVGVAGT